MFADQHATLLCFSSDTGEWVCGSRSTTPWAAGFGEETVSSPTTASSGGWISPADSSSATRSRRRRCWTSPRFRMPTAISLMPRAPTAQGERSPTAAFSRSALASSGAWSGALAAAAATTNDPDTKEWALEYKVSFQGIWADESYKATGLSEKNTTFALVHPMNPDVAYFFLDEYLFSVDMPANRVVECGVYDLVVPPSDERPPNCFSVRALELPPALSAASLPSDVGSGSNTEESAPASSLSLASLKIESEEDQQGEDGLGLTRDITVRRLSEWSCNCCLYASNVSMLI